MRALAAARRLIGISALACVAASCLPGARLALPEDARSAATMIVATDPVPDMEPDPPPPPRTFTLLAAGDILLDRTPGKRAAERGYRFLFEGIKDIVTRADVAFANLESPASYLGAPYPGKDENITFRADPATLFGVAWAGFDVLSLANNHMSDYGPRAVQETLEFIDLLGMERCGAGRSLEEARSPAVVYRDGVSFAFLAYAEPIWSAIVAESDEGARRAGRAEERLHGALPPSGSPVRPDSPFSSKTGIAPAYPEDIVADIARVRQTLEPDYLFVSVHWGDEHQHLPNRFQRSLGRAMIDAGATAVLGHHPHVLQSLERYGNGLIIYSLGNLVFDMRADRTYETAAVELALSSGTIESATILPLRIPRGAYAPLPAIDADADARLDGIKRWSAALGTDVRILDGTGIINF